MRGLTSWSASDTLSPLTQKVSPMVCEYGARAGVSQVARKKRLFTLATSGAARSRGGGVGSSMGQEERVCAHGSFCGHSPSSFVEFTSSTFGAGLTAELQLFVRRSTWLAGKRKSRSRRCAGFCPFACVGYLV